MKVRRGDPCTIEGCGKPVVGRGWCSKHYATWRGYGDPLHPVRQYVRQGAPCQHKGCEEPPHSRGCCKKHVRRLLAHGETTDSYERRFWEQVDRRGSGECWPWTGWLQPNGYGLFGASTARLSAQDVPHRTRLVHRIAYQFLVGTIPDGLVLDHLCHTRDPQCADIADCPHRRCCNPAHLEPVTRRENIARGRGGDSWGYVLDPILVKPRAEKPTVCVECQRTEKPVYKRALCRSCYRKWSKDPSVERPSQRTPDQRFWEKVQKTPTCWLWTASVNPATGYGHFGIRHGVMVQAHRYSYELANGPVPAGLDVHHTCHTRRCVNPAHLQALTRSENLRLRKVRRT